MKKIALFLLITALALLLTALIIAPTEVEALPAEQPPKQELSYQQKVWLGALQWCESKGNPEAVNPKDRDNTPSYGLLQFKPSTFTYYQKRYGTPAGTGYMDPDAQLAIVEQMILRGDVKWSQQFPECTKKIGKPPVIPTKALIKNNKGV